MVGFLENNIKPVFVFKSNIEETMATDWALYNIKITNCRIEQTGCIPYSLYLDVKVLLKHFGVPLIETHLNVHEEICRIAKFEESYAVVSEDLLFLAFGASNLLRYVDSSRNLMRQISLEQILKDFKMSFEQFTDLCILLGNDYSPSFSHIKPGKIFNLISKRNTIEDSLNALEEEVSKQPENFKPGISEAIKEYE